MECRSLWLIDNCCVCVMLSLCVGVCCCLAGYLFKKLHPHKLFFDITAYGHGCDVCRKRIKESYRSEKRRGEERGCRAAASSQQSTAWLAHSVTMWIVCCSCVVCVVCRCNVCDFDLCHGRCLNEISTSRCSCSLSLPPLSSPSRSPACACWRTAAVAVSVLRSQVPREGRRRHSRRQGSQGGA